MEKPHFKAFTRWVHWVGFGIFLLLFQNCSQGFVVQRNEGATTLASQGSETPDSGTPSVSDSMPPLVPPPGAIPTPTPANPPAQTPAQPPNQPPNQPPTQTPTPTPVPLPPPIVAMPISAEKLAQINLYRQRFDSVYATQKNLFTSNAKTAAGPYELIYPHFALNEMYLGLRTAGVADASTYAMESLRLMELEIENAKLVDKDGYLNWELNHRQVEYHFSIEGARLCRLMLEDAKIAAGIRTRCEKIRDFIARNVIEKWATVREPGTFEYYIKISKVSNNPEAISDYVTMLATTLKEVAAQLPNGNSKKKLYDDTANAIFVGFRGRFADFSPPGPAGTMNFDAYANYSYSGIKNNGLDTSHSLRHLIAFRMGYEFKLPGYTDKEAIGLGKLLGYRIWNQDEKYPLFTNYQNGNNQIFVGHPPFTAGNIMAGWPWLAQFDPQARKAMNAIYTVRLQRGSVSAPGLPYNWSDSPWTDLSTSASLIRAVIKDSASSAFMPPYTPRANKRYIATTGSDSNTGLSPQAAWRKLQPNVGKIPANTEVIFMNGIHEYDDSVYFSSAGPVPLPPDITLRPETFRGATLRGSATPLKTKTSSGIGFVFIGGDRRVEVWGFIIEGWTSPGAGTMLVEYDVDGLRIVGNHFRKNDGKDFHHQLIYLSGGNSYATTQRNWVIEHNTVELVAGNGTFMNIRGGPFGAHDGIVRYNKVTGASRWAIVMNDVRQPGTQSNIHIHDNEFSGTFEQAVVQFANYNTPTNLNGCDPTFVMERNRMENLNPNGYVLWRYPLIEGGLAQHAPTFRNNSYWNASGKVLGDMQKGSGDLVNGT